MAKILVFMADGCEEIEALTVVDVLRRGGFTVDCASVSGEKHVNGAHGIVFHSDMGVAGLNASDYDAVVLPGGNPGFKNLTASKEVKELVLSANESGKLVAAICASPTVLGDFGILKGKNACCYPGMEDGMIGANPTTMDVTIDGNIITSRGMGTSIDFSLAIVEYFTDKETADELGKTFVWDRA